MRSVKGKGSVMRDAMGHLLRSCVPVGAVSLLVNLLMLTGPLYMLQVYDRVLSSRSEQTLIALTALVIGLYALMAMLDGIRSAMMVRIASVFESQLSPSIFRANAKLAVLATHDQGRPDPVRDIDQCRQFLSSSGPLALFDLPWLPIYLGLVFIIHPMLGFLALIGAVVLVVLMIINDHGSRRHVAQTASENASRSTFAHAVRNNPAATLGMGMLSHLSGLWSRKTAALLAANKQAADRSGSFKALSKSIRLFLQSGVLGMGAYLALSDQISAGMMIAASIVTARALAPVEQAIGSWRGLVATRQAVGRLTTVLDITADRATTSNLPLPQKNLTVETLYSGPNSNNIVLRGVSFSLNAGEGLGVIGSSGSGKTTLARALLGIWPSVAGSVRLDGATIDQWEPEAIGRAVGFLPQEAGLFDGTIADNIARFDPKATTESIVKAAKLAGVHELITRFTDGYSTILGEGSVQLSAGQRQRIGLARALYGDPFLVVLDEPNANLDASGDALLAKAIKSVRDRGGIVIVIAHRPSAISTVDHLLMIQNGRQQAFGSKQDVLQRMTKNAAQIQSVVGLEDTSHA